MVKQFAYQKIICGLWSSSLIIAVLAGVFLSMGLCFNFLNFRVQKAYAGGLHTKVGTFTAKSGTGEQSITGVGFQPKAVLFWITDRTSEGNSPNVRFGRGWTDGTNEFAEAVARQDGTDNSQDRVVNDKVITLINAGGSVLAEASMVSLDTDGFTLNWTTAGGSRKVTYLALGGPSLTNVKAGGFLWPWNGGSYSETGVDFEPDAVIFGGSEDQKT